MNNRIVIHRPRMVLVITEDEILNLLKQSPDIWATALRRGKGYCRYETAMDRKPKR